MPCIEWRNGSVCFKTFLLIFSVSNLASHYKLLFIGPLYVAGFFVLGLGSIVDFFHSFFPATNPVRPCYSCTAPVSCKSNLSWDGQCSCWLISSWKSSGVPSVPSQHVTSPSLQKRDGLGSKSVKHSCTHSRALGYPRVCIQEI